jgi:hypothetical protein
MACDLFFDDYIEDTDVLSQDHLMVKEEHLRREEESKVLD